MLFCPKVKNCSFTRLSTATQIRALIAHELTQAPVTMEQPPTPPSDTPPLLQLHVHHPLATHSLLLRSIVATPLPSGAPTLLLLDTNATSPKGVCSPRSTRRPVTFATFCCTPHGLACLRHRTADPFSRPMLWRPRISKIALCLALPLSVEKAASTLSTVIPPSLALSPPQSERPRSL